eukprot:GHVU01119906.1.p1 GENE.GHVU01119906.1~~GHVU01119906.1.p1  ORF type:complete len:205 (-),score=17.22 GHVU01119906.1:178-792(-)
MHCQCLLGDPAFHRPERLNLGVVRGHEWMWLHGGRFLNGVCLYIRCCHNTPDLAMKIRVVSPKKTQLIKATMAEITPESRKDLLGFIYDRVQVQCSMGSFNDFGFPIPAGNKETRMKERKYKHSDRDLLEHYQLDVYMHDVERNWFWLTSSDVKANEGWSTDGDEPSVDVLVTNYEGTWPGLCVWVRSHVPLWVVSRDLVGSVQ